MNYLLHLIILIEIYVMLSLSLNLMVGYTGLLSLAQAAFYGIGAYITSLLMIGAEFSFLTALFVSALAAVVLSFSISLASLRFRGDHFILTTLAFQVLIFTILYNWVSVTRGPFGISKIPAPALGSYQIHSLPGFAILGFVVTALVATFLAVVYRSPFARTLRAIRDDELAARSLGKEAVSYKMRSVAIASACAATAGGFYATYVSFIDPSSFTADESILMLSMVIVGGTGNFKGPLVGAVLLVLLPECLRFLALPPSLAANVRLVVYGLLLIAMMQLRPQGILGEYKFD